MSQNRNIYKITQNHKSKEKNTPIPESFLKLRDLQGYIIVGDGNWGQNVLMTTFRCCGHQHSKDVTDIEIPLPTSQNRHQHKVTIFCVAGLRSPIF